MHQTAPCYTLLRFHHSSELAQANGGPANPKPNPITRVRTCVSINVQVEEVESGAGGMWMCGDWVCIVVRPL
eukprot:CAMPEP_0174379436 /NCGR_PEP_ID=MMETSP0811_2-20130205/122714_1 /TAXON_ID=73025 ORGANISM="Eutreptiella gymnastica-like, Strain CCMP1594" /NCGR_SAMPLE_ID=MMETSP0811_2 /ASSEMBLY_ACC=CAM_ASM_000667 /LENGTH=71 /DNA_ID=CAMNT_0015531985 /DNA_START=84 /DNA_END=299 /DNA_ORIENTATION=+